MLKHYFLWVFLAAVATASGCAHADTFTDLAGNVTTGAGGSMAWINQLFGAALGGTDDVFSPIIGVINTATLFLGGLLIAYTLVVGTLNTAHDGEMLGKKWSSVWLPVRIALGVALISPIPAYNNYSGVQVVMAQMIKMGAELGDLTYGAYVDHYVMPQGNATNFTASYAVRLPNLDRAEVELALLQPLYRTVFAQADQMQSLFNLQTQGNGYNAYQYGVRFYCDTDDAPVPAAITDSGFSGATFSLGGCANPSQAKNIRVDFVQYQVDPTTGQVGRVVVYDSLAPIKLFSPVSGNPVNLTGVNAGLVTLYHDALIQTAALALQAYAQDLPASAIKTRKNQILDNLLAGYKAQVVTNPQTTAVLNNQVLAHLNANKSNWLAAGTQYLGAASAVNAISGQGVGSLADGDAQATTATELDGTNADVANKASQAEVFTQESGGLGWLDRMWGAVKSGVDVSGKIENLVAPLKAFMADPARELTKMIVKRLTGLNITNLAGDPIMVAKMVGDNLLSSADTMVKVIMSIFAVAGVIALAGGALSLIPTITAGPTATGIASFVATTGSTFANIMLPIVFIMVVAGATLSVYVPMIPFIIWTGALIAYLALVVEAMIAAPLWAVMHLHPSGDDHVGKGANGYMLLLGVVLRPAFLVVGFAAAVAVMGIIGGWINGVMTSVIASLGQSSEYSLVVIIKMVAGVLVYGVLMLAVIHKSFSLIYHIPDQIMRWLGGAGEQLGTSIAGGMQSASDAAKLSAFNAANSAGSAIGGGLTDAAGRVLTKPKAKKSSADAGENPATHPERKAAPDTKEPTGKV